MNRLRQSLTEAEQLRRGSLMLYTMALIGNRRKRGLAISAGLAAGLDRKQIDADLRRYRMVQHA